MEGDGASLLSPLTARCEEAGVAERRWHRCMSFFRDRPLRRAWRMGTEVVVLVQKVFLKVFFPDYCTMITRGLDAVVRRRRRLSDRAELKSQTLTDSESNV